jgi:hypothetical protein
MKKGMPHHVGPEIAYHDALKMQLLHPETGQPWVDELGINITVANCHASAFRAMVNEALVGHPAERVLRNEMGQYRLRWDADRWHCCCLCLREKVVLPIVGWPIQSKVEVK